MHQNISPESPTAPRKATMKKTLKAAGAAAAALIVLTGCVPLDDDFTTTQAQSLTTSENAALDAIKEPQVKLGEWTLKIAEPIVTEGVSGLKTARIAVDAHMPPDCERQDMIMSENPMSNDGSCVSLELFAAP